MKKILFFLFIYFSSTIFSFAGPPSKAQNPDWPCIQVLIEELSWGSIWTGPPLNEISAKWQEKKELSLLATKIMDRKTKEEDGIKELTKYINKNNSTEDLQVLFHALFDKFFITFFQIFPSLGQIFFLKIQRIIINVN